jgi:hypothetical protein
MKSMGGVLKELVEKSYKIRVDLNIRAEFEVKGDELCEEGWMCKVERENGKTCPCGNVSICNDVLKAIMGS